MDTKCISKQVKSLDLVVKAISTLPSRSHRGRQNICPLYICGQGIFRIRLHLQRQVERKRKREIMSLVFAINGQRFELELSSVDPSTTLLEFLRYQTTCKSVKLSCGEGDCFFFFILSSSSLWFFV